MSALHVLVSREACDTMQSGSLVDSGEYANEEIMTRCNPLVCNKGTSSSFYEFHPTNSKRECMRRDGEMVTHRRNVPRKFGSNLCKQVPVVPSRCTTSHGMLQNLKGRDVGTLYTDQVLRHSNELVSRTGAGLFVHGGNPIYYTAKGTSEDIAAQVHSVLRGNLDDLGGHHIVLKIFKETWSGDKYMKVDRTPLAAIDVPSSSGADDPAVYIYQQTLASLGTSLHPSSTTLDLKDIGSGWLYELQGRMKLEQGQYRVDKLYPVKSTVSSSSTSSSSSSGNRWSCPLRRLSFWSKVAREFSPLLPSPARSNKLFGESSGRNMLFGTRSHPTQMFSSLYDTLANIITSNGFCFCVNWLDCQIASSSPVNRDCTLLETVRSMYDGKFRTVNLLTVNDPVCTRQLDWPFAGGVMRDLMMSPSRYSSQQVPTDAATGACNVLDRLPPFQYRYMPVGKVVKPSDGRTSLSEGGSCHMGRPARLPMTQGTVINTRICRKIYSNYTHIVARCFTSSGSTAYTVR